MLSRPIVNAYVILKNNSITLLLKGLFLILTGAKHIGFHLLKNSIRAVFKDRKRFKINVHFFKNLSFMYLFIYFYFTILYWFCHTLT